MHRVVSLDPGGTTGYLVGYIGEPGRAYFSYGQHPWREKELYDALLNLRPDTLICESFEYRQNARAGLDLTPAHLIGIVRLYADVKGCTLHMQTAAQGKGHFTDDKLKKLLIYERSYKHGRDALRHFLQWFTFGAGYKYNDNSQLCLVQEQYLLDSYFDRVVL